MPDKKNLALVAHDNCKKDLIEWVGFNWEKLLPHRLICTGTTGGLVEAALEDIIAIEKNAPPLQLTKLKSGPLGGDQMLGAMISEGEVDLFVFFWDTMSPQPHDVDVKALLRIAVLYNIPTACNRASADFLITSSLFEADYQPKDTDFSSYKNRPLP